MTTLIPSFTAVIAALNISLGADVGGFFLETIARELKAEVWRGMCAPCASVGATVEQDSPPTCSHCMRPRLSAWMCRTFKFRERRRNHLSHFQIHAKHSTWLEFSRLFLWALNVFVHLYAVVAIVIDVGLGFYRRRERRGCQWRRRYRECSPPQQGHGFEPPPPSGVPVQLRRCSLHPRVRHHRPASGRWALCYAIRGGLSSLPTVF